MHVGYETKMGIMKGQGKILREVEDREGNVVRQRRDQLRRKMEEEPCVGQGEEREHTLMTCL